MANFNYTLSSFDEDFPAFSKAFRDFCEKQNMGEETIFGMEVSLEELIVNSFSYGNANGKVTVTADIQDNELKVCMEDNAPPFDLLKEAPPPPEGSIEERKVGGLGIHLVKSLNDRVEYSSSDQGNQITLFKSF